MERTASLAAMDVAENRGGRIVFSRRTGRQAYKKPHRVFWNWKQLYSLPWMCFIDVAVFVLYFLLGMYHQKSRIAFNIDMSQAVTKYFLKDIDLSDPFRGIPTGDGQIWFIDDFRTILNTTAYRLFAFPDDFPLAHTFLREDNASIMVELINGSLVKIGYGYDDIGMAMEMIDGVVRSFKLIAMTMEYHMQITGETSEMRVDVTVSAAFAKSDYTGTIRMDVSHVRVEQMTKLDWETVERTLDYSLPLMIIVLNVIELVIIGRSVYVTTVYTRGHAIDSGLNPREVFRRKFDIWNIYAVVTHAVSITATVMYAFWDQDVQQQRPIAIFIIALAALMHSMLMVRYLKLKRSTMLVATVFYKSAIKILQFLMGCLPIYIGFLAVGVCFFGHIAVDLASPMQAATFLFCLMHGDSISELYDAVIVQNDLNIYIGFMYASCWVAFSLLIMFNVTIAIVQEVLTAETYNIEHRHDNDADIPAFNTLISNDLAILARR